MKHFATNTPSGTPRCLGGLFGSNVGILFKEPAAMHSILLRPRSPASAETTVIHLLRMGSKNGGHRRLFTKPRTMSRAHFQSLNFGRWSPLPAILPTLSTKRFFLLFECKSVIISQRALLRPLLTLEAFLHGVTAGTGYESSTRYRVGFRSKSRTHSLSSRGLQGKDELFGENAAPGGRYGLIHLVHERS